jgi:uncharacterized membrane protein HdeD (DUF308 family)
MKMSSALIAVGVVTVALGALALLNPFPASLAALTLVAAGFLISGAFQLFQAFDGSEIDKRLWWGLIGLASLVLGVWLIARPMQGLVSLTIAVGVIILLGSIFRLLHAWSFPAPGTRLMAILAGIAGVVLAGLILFNIPGSAAESVGILLGISLLFNGSAETAIGLALRRKDM